MGMYPTLEKKNRKKQGKRFTLSPTLQEFKELIFNPTPTLPKRKEKKRKEKHFIPTPQQKKHTHTCTLVKVKYDPLFYFSSLIFIALQITHK
jgi:hypothetical protein